MIIIMQHTQFLNLVYNSTVLISLYSLIINLSSNTPKPLHQKQRTRMKNMYKQSKPNVKLSMRVTQIHKHLQRYIVEGVISVLFMIRQSVEVLPNAPTVFKVYEHKYNFNVLSRAIKEQNKSYEKI